MFKLFSFVSSEFLLHFICISLQGLFAEYEIQRMNQIRSERRALADRAGSRGNKQAITGVMFAIKIDAGIKMINDSRNGFAIKVGKVDVLVGKLCFPEQYEVVRVKNFF
ncbi:hypothetical protein Zmor_027290 [Zophobas morio]|uniref:Uncharacterized protein n=1 Tax=Zophobas morio TaxID=2755281 RepID=A0AA38M376_9CUCU|nr:hypothetical protein Zmor_027290 [Zophobas morio]